MDKIEAMSPTAPFSNPTTSKAAADALDGFLSPKRFRVWDLIAEKGPISDHDVAKIMDVDRSSISPRRLELWMAGLVQDSGQTTKTPGGQDAIQWIANFDFDPNKVVQATQAIRAAGKTQRVLIGEIESAKNAYELKLPSGIKFIIAPAIFEQLVGHLADAESDELVELFDLLATRIGYRMGEPIEAGEDILAQLDDAWG